MSLLANLHRIFTISAWSKPLIIPQLIQNRQFWQAALIQQPTAHILQTWEWGEFKAQTLGWQPLRYAYQTAEGDVRGVASVLKQQMAGVSVLYVPKGPALAYDDTATLTAILDHLQQLARQHRAIWIKIDPDLPLGTGIPAAPDAQANPLGEQTQAELRRRGWQFSAEQIQFRNTLTLDLTQSEEDLLAQMNQSTRRKIRQAEKAGVSVRAAELHSEDSPDLATLYRLYQVTGERQGFIIRPADYYHLAWGIMARAGLAQGFIAEVEEEAVAGLVLFLTSPKAWYFYGMSSPAKREAQPNYLLQWTAIRWAKAAGYPIYDWWGAPDNFIESDSMWGVYRFKDGFGGQVVRHLGAWDYTPFPPLYWGYRGDRSDFVNILRNLLRI